ncbi:competence protein ComK [Metabacillus arenae]|uniref:Competence protein ComK n=1 Tax=Metabacillus arenae TaxID=2771434 RepID=A0A926NGN8_9BACI|nr:competence protein ComK [Metabacillus arenae]MBD1383114.1 competence protein ComK [Metabacillus arenae]
MKKIGHLIDTLYEEKSTYTIWGETMAIIPIYSEYGELHSIVIEIYRIIKVKISPKQIIEESCDYYGCTMSGCLESAQNILKGKKMLPVLISKVDKLCMIPIISADNPDNVWLSYKHIFDVIADGKNSTAVLSNYKKVKLEISKETLNTKIEKAGHLICTYDLRSERLKETYKQHLIAEQETIYQPEDSNLEH